MHSEEDPLFHFEGLQMGLFVFHRKRLEPSVTMATTRRCHSVSGAKFKEHCSDKESHLTTGKFN